MLRCSILLPPHWTYCRKKSMKMERSGERHCKKKKRTQIRWTESSDGHQVVWELNHAIKSVAKKSNQTNTCDIWNRKEHGAHIKRRQTWQEIIHATEFTLSQTGFHICLFVKMLLIHRARLLSQMFYKRFLFQVWTLSGTSDDHSCFFIFFICLTKHTHSWQYSVHILLATSCYYDKQNEPIRIMHLNP